jgi:ATP-dependent protease ClpP protease subunit
MRDVYLYGEVGFDFTATTLRDELTQETGDVALHINSCGGDVFEGVTISSLIADYRKRTGSTVTAFIDGLAASAASYMALTANEVVLAKGSQVMIHNPMASCMWATAEDMRRCANSLDSVKTSIVDLYERKTGAVREDIEAYMDNETWFTTDEAIDFGIADRVNEDAFAIAASISERFKGVYNHIPSLCDTPANVVQDVQEDVPEAEAAEVEEVEATPSYVEVCGEMYRVIEKEGNNA